MKLLILISAIFFTSYSYSESWRELEENNRETYKMKRGDTLTKILKAKGFSYIFEKDGPLDEILYLNNLTLKSATKLKIGTEIIVPFNWKAYAAKIMSEKNNGYIANTPEYESNLDPPSDSSAVEESVTEDYKNTEDYKSPEKELEEEEAEFGSVFDQDTTTKSVKRETASVVPNVDAQEVEFPAEEDGNIIFKKPTFDLNEYK